MTEMTDREAIHRLILEYPRACDAGDFEGLGECFAHARVQFGLGDVVQGAANIEKFFREMMFIYEDGTPRVLHHATNCIIDFEPGGERAGATTWYVTFQEIPEVMPLQVIVSGQWHDRFEKRDGEWRMVERRFNPKFKGDTSRHVKPRPSVEAP